MFPGPTELRLIGYSIESIWTKKIQLTKGNFTRDEWNHLLCLFNIAISVLQFVLKRWQKDHNKIQEKKRVTAKSRLLMSLVARAPSNLPSSTSGSPGKRSYEHQVPWSAKAEREDRTGQPVVCSDPRTVPDYYHEQSTESSFSARYSKWDDNKAWSSQEWKADKSKGDGTVQPVVIPQRGARPQQCIIGDDETELDLSLGSKSFLDRVNDQVRKRQRRSSMNVTENEEKHSMIWGMFMCVTLESAVFMGKNYLDNCYYITITKDLTLKQMFDISARLVSEQDEISGVKTIDWEDYSWKYLSLIGDEQAISLQRTKVYVFSDSVLCLGNIFENLPIERCMRTKIGMFKSSSVNRSFDRIDGEPMEFEWNISKDSIRCSSVTKSKVYCTG